MAKEQTPSIWERLDFIQNPADLQKYVGRMVYLLRYSDNLIGTTKIADMNLYLLENNVLEEYTDDPHDITLLYGVVLNSAALPAELPKDLPSDYKLYVIRQDRYSAMEHEAQEDLDDVVDYIEYAMEDEEELKISDIAVVYAKEMGFILQASSGGNEVTHNHRKSMGVI